MHLSISSDQIRSELDDTREITDGVVEDKQIIELARQFGRSWYIYFLRCLAEADLNVEAGIPLRMAQSGIKQKIEMMQPHMVGDGEYYVDYSFGYQHADGFYSQEDHFLFWLDPPTERKPMQIGAVSTCDLLIQPWDNIECRLSSNVRPCCLINSIQGRKDSSPRGKKSDLLPRITKERTGLHPMELMAAHLITSYKKAIQSGWSIALREKDPSCIEWPRNFGIRDRFFERNADEITIVLPDDGFPISTEDMVMTYMLNHRRKRVQEILAEA